MSPHIYIDMQKQNIPIFTKVISLGNWCGPAYYIKHRGWKTESYPFDWNFETLESVRLCFQDDFKSFLDPNKSLITCVMELQDLMPDQQWSQQKNWDLFKKMFDSMKISVDPPSGKVRPSIVSLEGHETL